MAATTFSIESIGSSVGLGSADLAATVINVLRWGLGFLVLVAIAFFIVGAIDWMISGDSEVVKTRARRIMVYSLISLVIVLLAWPIVFFVARTAANVTQ